GHLIGDNLIADIGRILGATLDTSDILARIGGDEFCVLVTDPTADGAELKQRVTDALTLFNDADIRPYQLSVSIGVMQVSPTDSRSIDQLLVHADELMYEDKKNRLRGSLN
ncbi:MAG: diguanylate cyclase, partial [Mycobacterium sp.]|nr:diguanylate cyclase [Mycobacterium sp.]